MKNIKKIIFTIFSFFIVSACSNPSVKEDLQENNWEFVQSDGTSGEIDFANDTVIFSSTDILTMTTGHQYTLNEDETEITLTRDKPSYTGNESEKVVMKYTIKKKDNEYLLTLISDSSGESEKGFTITLIPKEAESTNEN
ncbi:hypothetical protein ACRCJU_09430 [Aerococcus urinaeequi]|uniref:hypothetical protein n=1 Tax=Aerococcus urinaeequi TaxID=51665 RepID=UPI003D6A1E39